MIKQIHFFGTSHTAGGGFEFDSKIIQKFGDENSHNLNVSRGEYLKKVYSGIFPNEKYTQENFSFPGQLNKLCKDKNLNIKIFNHAKQGYGNERMYRKFFEVINKSNFKKDESVFVFEFSDIERKEIFYQPINDFVIINYFATERNFYTNSIKLKKIVPHVELSSVARTYWYETKSDLDILEKDKMFFEDVVNKTINGEVQIKNLNQNTLMFLNFLKSQNFKFIIINMHDCIFDNLKKYINFIHHHILEYTDYLGNSYKNFFDFVHKNNLLILDETDGRIPDMHQGFISNKIISKLIFNHLIKNKFIKSDILEIKKEHFKLPKIEKTIIF